MLGKIKYRRKQENKWEFKIVTYFLILSYIIKIHATKVEQVVAKYLNLEVQHIPYNLKRMD
jgi:hypothetical protein